MSRKQPVMSRQQPVIMGSVGRDEADDHVARLDVGVVDHVLALHPARHLHEMPQMRTR